MPIQYSEALPIRRLQPDDRVRLHGHLPVLRRDDCDLQLGVDSDDAIVVSDPDGTVAPLLRLMDGRCRLSELRMLASDQLEMPGDRVDDLVATLNASGLLTHTATAGPEIRSVRVVGGGPTATMIAEQLLRAGIGRLLLVDPAGAPWRPTTDAGQDRIQRTAHWSHPQVDAVDLTVLVADTLETDRAVAADLTAADHPHLLVRPRVRGAVVGPFVLPGRTSCLRCGDLARTRADGAWPRLLAQLCRQRGDWDPLGAEWAAAMATTQVLGHLAGRPVETASATFELAPPAWSWQRRVWRADPACGCCWAPRAEW